MSLSQLIVWLSFYFCLFFAQILGYIYSTSFRGVNEYYFKPYLSQDLLHYYNGLLNLLLYGKIVVYFKIQRHK